MPIVEKELIPVSFNVGFRKEVTDFRSVAKSTEEPMPFGYGSKYLVYNKETGKLYKEKSFEAGIVNDELPEGKYIFLFVVFTNNVSFYETYDINSLVIYAVDSQNLVYDVFHCRVDYEVKKGEENSNQQVVLDRMVGKVKVVMEDEIDAIPENIAYIDVQISSGPIYFQYYPAANDYSAYGTGYKVFRIYSRQYPNTINEFSATSLECINYKTADGERFPIKITLYAVRERTPAEEGVVNLPFDDLLVAKKTIENVFIERNKTITYRGKLFDNIIPPGPDKLPSSSFSISMNNEWGEEINETF